jgi:hypothetical protein
MGEEQKQIETVELNMPVPKQAKELAEGLERAVIKIATALKDGVQVAQDAPAVIDALMNDILPALKGAASVKDELKAMPVETGLLGARLVANVIKAL